MGYRGAMRRQLGWLCILPALASLTPSPADAAGVSFMTAMQDASQARHVPLLLIEATAYVNSRFEWIATPSIDGGVGPMHVVPSQMAPAAALSGHSQAEIKSDLSANLDAGAALLAKAHTGGADLASWQPAVVATQGPAVAKEIYAVLRSGVTGRAATGEAIVLTPQSVSSSPAATAPSGSAAVVASVPDYPGATWNPANPANYSVADRPHDYPVQMIIIHDIEGSAGSAIQHFQDPSAAASAHYVVADNGNITQMVAEKDIAWHAGNWDYNTRAIGIEHEGFAYVQPTWYTTTMYNESAKLIASICSRWGVPMDRQHVIGHYQVPDPNNPGLFGGTDHHTDPGPYWDWTYYMNQAVADANALPSPPHMMPDPYASLNSPTSATVTWLSAQTCRKPITGYTVNGQPGNLTMSVPAGTTSATFNGLTAGVTYTFTVTATNPDGQDTLTAYWRCTSVNMSITPGSPQLSGTTVHISATSGGCPNPQYQFWTLAPGSSSSWTVGQAYSSTATFDWNTNGDAPGTYYVSLWVEDTTSGGGTFTSLGSFDAYVPGRAYTLTSAPCTSVTATSSPPSSTTPGTAVTITGSATGCPHPQYQFWILAPGSSTWTVAQAYSSSAAFNWNTTGKPMGVYRFSVWARDSSSTGSSCNSLGCSDAFVPGFTYTLRAPACTSVTASAAPTSPSSPGTPVAINASASGCSNPMYQFWMLAPGSSTWAVVQPYSSTATFNWNTTGKAVGTYRFSVWARDAASSGTSCNSLGCNDSFVPGFAYTLATKPCTSLTASAAPGSPQPSSTPVTITASASGCANPQYQFWILAPGSSTWTKARAYSSSATFNWNTSGLPPGTYRYSVWVRDASSGGTTSTSLGSFDAFVPGTAYTLT